MVVGDLDRAEVVKLKQHNAPGKLSGGRGVSGLRPGHVFLREEEREGFRRRTLAAQQLRRLTVDGAKAVGADVRLARIHEPRHAEVADLAQEACGLAHKKRFRNKREDADRT